MKSILSHKLLSATSAKKTLKSATISNSGVKLHCAQVFALNQKLKKIHALSSGPRFKTGWSHRCKLMLSNETVLSCAEIFSSF
jgi:hypothetical protein